MKFKVWPQRCLRDAVFLSVLLLVGAQAGALTLNRWTNAVSSVWQVSTNWSAAVPPSASYDVEITNANTKTVTITSATPTANLACGRLSLSAPIGSTNGLRLTDLSAAGPLTASGTVTIGRGGVLSVTNSSFLARNTFDIAGGQLVLDGGLVDTSLNSVDVRVGRLNGSTGTVLLNGGLLKCYGFRLGELSGSPGSCTVNGGTLVCASLLDMGEVLNSPGTLTILSGQVFATNDMTRVGNLSAGEFNQSGGASSLSFWSIADNAPGTANISGGRVTVTPTGPLDVTRVGNFGTGQLNISGGGLVWLRGEFHVADNPGVQGSVLMTGGALIATNAQVAIGRYGIGDLTITNATAYFTNTSVGRHTDATGTLNVQNGAAVYVDDLSIGRFTNGTGFVNVWGGLLSVADSFLWVGREGIGNLAVSGGMVRAKGLFVGMSEDGTNAPQGTAVFSGGTTIVSSNMTVGTSLLSTGQVSVLGGVLAVTNAAGTGRLNVVNGNCTLSQG
ncbi:MAG TPA: hypothetical protein VNZ22_06505, partial [Bacillota bacterium]|nr:hypothetical protein [Bacillota bacterium]